MCRIGWFVVVVSVVGCWSSPDTIDGFTPEQWSVLQQQLRYAPPAPAPMDASAVLGLELFQDTALSANAMVSCKTCHDPNHADIDSRVPNNVSLGAGGWTKHNAMTLYNVCLKAQMAGGADVFTWDGGYTSPGQVLVLALKGKPFGWASYAQGAGALANLIRMNGNYWMLYTAAFNQSPGDDMTIIGNLEKALDSYFCTPQFMSPVSQFDLWLAGEPSTLSDSAKRGFAVFVGRGTCIECHNTPLFSDLQFHDTGVPQVGDHVPLVDNGRADVTMDPADTGKFLTGALREIANTGPYMHDGAFATLADVIDFYRHGGVASGYSGTRDPRIVPLDLTDGDALDLEAFLDSISCPDPTSCSAAPAMPQRDAGMLDVNAPPPDVGPAPDSRPPDAFSCPPGMTLCGPMMCVDTQIDPMNCGACGNTCTAPKPNCVMGTCAH